MFLQINRELLTISLAEFLIIQQLGVV